MMVAGSAPAGAAEGSSPPPPPSHPAPDCVHRQYNEATDTLRITNDCDRPVHLVIAHDGNVRRVTIPPGGTVVLRGIGGEHPTVAEAA
jgi:hypothetical protein